MFLINQLEIRNKVVVLSYDNKVDTEELLIRLNKKTEIYSFQSFLLWIKVNNF